MVLPIDGGALLLRVPTPQHEHDTGALPMVEGLYNSVRKALPPPVPMRAWLPRNNSEHRIKEQHTLVSPLLQAPVLGPREPRNILLELAEDVEQRWRREDTVLHREAHAMGLSRSVVGVLSNDDNSRPREGRVVEGGEDLLRGRVHCTCVAFSGNEFCKGGPEGFVEGGGEGFPPGGLQRRAEPCFGRTVSRGAGQQLGTGRSTVGFNAGLDVRRKYLCFELLSGRRGEGGGALASLDDAGLLEEGCDALLHVG